MLVLQKKERFKKKCLKRKKDEKSKITWEIEVNDKKREDC